MQVTDVRQSSERVPMLPLQSAAGKNNLTEFYLMMWKDLFIYLFNN